MKPFATNSIGIAPLVVLTMWLAGCTSLDHVALKPTNPGGKEHCVWKHLGGGGEIKRVGASRHHCDHHAQQQAGIGASNKRAWWAFLLVPTSATAPGAAPLTCQRSFNDSNETMW
jgi:hypothetical protein